MLLSQLQYSSVYRGVTALPHSDVVYFPAFFCFVTPSPPCPTPSHDEKVEHGINARVLPIFECPKVIF